MAEEVPAESQESPISHTGHVSHREATGKSYQSWRSFVSHTEVTEVTGRIACELSAQSKLWGCLQEGRFWVEIIVKRFGETVRDSIDRTTVTADTQTELERCSEVSRTLVRI